MAVFQTFLVLPRSLAEVFDFFLQPSLVIQTAPPELNLQLIEAPERLTLGACVRVKGRRWGIPHRATTQVTALLPERLLVERQIEGTFKRWELMQLFESQETGTRIETRIDFEPPGGLLGLTITEDRVLKELEGGMGYRAEKLREIFG